jgi:hypothetical protein
VSWGEFGFALAAPGMALVLVVLSILSGDSTRAAAEKLVKGMKGAPRGASQAELIRQIDGAFKGSNMLANLISTLFGFSIGVCSVLVTVDGPGWLYAAFCLVPMTVLTLYVMVSRNIGATELDTYLVQNPFHGLFGRRTFGLTYFRLFERSCLILNIVAITTIVGCKAWG